ncbi:ribosome small subunit-dependent GTPase A [Bacillus pinisoli]|uniref:ribosome small subunit-dependent GTPase A n=1 Tax=Bacillus pinisoli TaxID=2901866 RepID=UPI001FF21245|nr:ribosome small subunit-dependent GTPase A [Bacillus pinisoli]
MNLKSLGWNCELEEIFNQEKQLNWLPGRVSLEHKRMYRILTEEGELLAEITGKMRFQADGREDYPAVGDWVMVSPRISEGKATIHGILPRFSKFSRKVAGLTIDEQIVATNVNTVFLVNALNQDFNVRRIERYLLLAWESGANPVIVLTKADVCHDIEEKINLVEGVAFGVPIHVTSVKNLVGLEALLTYFEEGQTVALLGSSGAGKSTLTNYLLGEEKQVVQDIRDEDGKGRHTTTHRELVKVPTGGIIIDTPGMRELQLWEADSGMSQSFSDVEDLAEQCYFRDCQHNNEPKCAVRDAIATGTLEEERYLSYLKLQKELAYLERKTDKKAQMAEKEKWKKIAGDRTRVHRK